ELFLGQDVNKRVNSTGTETVAQTKENYSLTRVAKDPGTTNGGETIIVSALTFQQTYTNVQEILVNNTLPSSDTTTTLTTISVDNGIQVPVYMTLAGNNTITTGSGAATVTEAGPPTDKNQITSGNSANITISARGKNLITTGNSSQITVSD